MRDRRPGSHPQRPDPRGTVVLGVDVGGTKTTAALADSEGRLLRKERAATDASGGASAGLETIFTLVSSLLEWVAPLSRVVRIGVGFGGPVDYSSGTVLLSHHVAGWMGMPLKRKLEERFGVPTVVDNDANAAGLGEFIFGAARGRNHALYVNIGTGIGGAIIANGRLIRGAQSAAGEIGHMVLDPEGPPCTCGRRGCLEALASGSAIGRRAGELRESGALPTTLPPVSSAEQVCAAAAAGDPLAQRVFAETVQWLARGLGVAADLLNPDIIVLGGGVSELGDQLLVPLRAALPRYVLPQTAPFLTVVTAELGYDSGVRGAVALALTEESP